MRELVTEIWTGWGEGKQENKLKSLPWEEWEATDVFQFWRILYNQMVKEDKFYKICTDRDAKCKERALEDNLDSRIIII